MMEQVYYKLTNQNTGEIIYIGLKRNSSKIPVSVDKKQLDSIGMSFLCDERLTKTEISYDEFQSSIQASMAVVI